MDEDNPWQVVSIEAFYCLKCPECMYFTTDDNGFYDHAVENHPLSGVLFGKPKVEVINLEDSFENEENETLSEKTFETNTEDCNIQIETLTESYVPFSCKICTESFSDLSDMKMHLKIHDKSILGQTNVLEKESFKNPKTLNQGEISYTNKPENMESSPKTGEYIPTVHEFKKQFKCSNCDASFKKRPSLKKHICNDKIGKQFQCEYCRLIFNSNVKMKYHISREHKNTHIDHPRGTSILGEVRHV